MKMSRPSVFAEDAPAFRGDLQLRQIQASMAKAHLAELLDAVERGETIVITRHGRAVARLIPEARERRQEIAEAIEGMKILAGERAERFGKMSVEEVLSLRHEGHKY
jgi:prevent-host-death family protein